MATVLPANTPSLRVRFDALSARERRMLALLAVALVAFLLYLMLRGGGNEVGPAETASRPPVPVVTPAPPPVASTPPPASVAPAPAPASASGLLLVGVFGGGPGGGAAILQTPDGSQRRVRIGREVMPGLLLRAVGLRHVVLATGSGDVRLEIGKAGAIPVAAPPSGPAPAMPVPPLPKSAGEPTAEVTRRETMQYQLGTEPVTTDGGISGYRIKPGARLPHLDRAGMLPGDVIVGINGGGFNEERLAEMSYDIATAPRTEFEVIRNGRRMRLAVER